MAYRIELCHLYDPAQLQHRMRWAAPKFGAPLPNQIARNGLDTHLISVHWFLGVSVLLKYPQRWLMNRPAHHGPNYPSARIALAGNAV